MPVLTHKYIQVYCTTAPSDTQAAKGHRAFIRDHIIPLMNGCDEAYANVDDAEFGNLMQCEKAITPNDGRGYITPNDGGLYYAE
jgi:hypothetical protein